MTPIHLIKLMFCLKILFILFCVYLIFKLIIFFLQWKSHKILQLPKLIFIIICLIIGIKGYSTVHSIQSSAQNHEAKIIKTKNATRRLYERKGSKAIAKKAGHQAKQSGTKFLIKSKNKYYIYKNKFLNKYHAHNNNNNNNNNLNSKQLHHEYENNSNRIQNIKNKHA